VAGPGIFGHNGGVIPQFIRPWLAKHKIPDHQAAGLAGLMLGARRAVLEEVFLSTGFDQVPHDNCTVEPLDPKIKLDLMTVAFNSPDTIAWQIKLIKKNLKDPYVYSVADNSSRPEVRPQIRQICREAGAAYISLPPNPYVSPSSNHGLGLNWLYRNYVQPRAAQYFGFLDHDIFPIRPTTLINLTDADGFYGRTQYRDDKWYLWPGFSFYRRDRVAGLKLNFLPAAGLDTGGGNWPVLYSQYPKPPMADLATTYRKLREGDDPQHDLVEYFGDWLHTIDASGWKPVAGKQNLVTGLLNKY
jgi:hypothetical protein